MGVGNGDVVICYDVSIMVIYVSLMKNNNLVIACGNRRGFWRWDIVDDYNIYRILLE
jgi:hypothetical protein